MESEFILDIQGLTVYYETDEGVAKAVNDLDITLKRRATLGLVGETGSGKTTTALSILRLVPDPPGKIKGGRVYLDGIDIFQLSEKEMDDKVRGTTVSMIFQDPMTSLNPVLTVEYQISEAIQVHQDVSNAEAAAKAKELLELVGIPAERASEYPHQFSGGMKQRVIIAIALACNPQILIADEPTTALDVTIQAQILEVMKDLRNKFGMSMIMITHDLGIIAEVCDEVSVIYAGRIVEHGSIRDVFKRTLHPYTEGLLQSLPQINDDREMLVPIPGMMPDPMELPPGCAFEPRCAYGCDRCKNEIPGKYYVSDSHYVACFAYNDPEFSLKGDR